MQFCFNKSNGQFNNNKNKLIRNSMKPFKIDKENSNTLNSVNSRKLKAYLTPSRILKTSLNGLTSSEKQKTQQKMQQIRTPDTSSFLKKTQILTSPFYKPKQAQTAITSRTDQGSEPTSNVLGSAGIKNPAISKFANLSEGAELHDFSEVKRKMGVIQAKFLNLKQNSHNLQRVIKGCKQNQRVRRSGIIKGSTFNQNSQNQNFQFDAKNLTVTGKQLQLVKKLNPDFYIVYLETFRSLKNSEQECKQFDSIKATLELKEVLLKQQKRKLKVELNDIQIKRIQQKSQTVTIQKRLMNKYNADDQQNFEREAIQQGFNRSRMICI